MNSEESIRKATSVQFKALWLKLGLKWQYRLSFGTLSNYDSILVLLSDGNGVHWGEATALPGYSWETPDQIWAAVLSLLDCSNDKLSELEKAAYRTLERNPFAVTAVLTAVEKYRGINNFNNLSISIDIPLVGILKGHDYNALSVSAEELIVKGFNTLKLKLIGDPDKDERRLRAVQEVVRGHEINVRLDVNQGYNYAEAKRFLKSIEIDSIELFEQPFPRDAWDWNSKLTRWCPVPLMLDESIWSADDVERAAHVGADLVKLKLVKHGGIRSTLDIIKKAKSLNLSIVLGNGVQTHLGCLDECLLYNAANIELAGEMNGFLKMNDTLLKEGLRYEQNSAIVDQKRPMHELIRMDDLLPGIYKSVEKNLRG